MDQNTQTYTEPLGDTWKYDADYNRTAEFLGVDKYEREDYDTAKKIAYLRDFVDSEGKNKTLDDSLWSLHSMRKRLGLNIQGKTLVNQLYLHSRLKQDSTRKKAPVASQKKPTSLKQSVEQTVQKSVTDMVQKTLTNKELIQKTIQTVISKSLK